MAIDRISSLFNSGLKPLAQTTIPCASQFIETDECYSSVARLLSSNFLSLPDKAVIELMMLNGCRISEALSIKPCDIKSNGYVKLQSLKHSSDRILITSVYKNFWLFVKKNNVANYTTSSRFYFYRLFKKFGICIKPLNSSKNAVCHSFRHILLKSISENEEELMIVKAFIGQKSLNSTLHYVKKKKSKN